MLILDPVTSSLAVAVASAKQLNRANHATNTAIDNLMIPSSEVVLMRDPAGTRYPAKWPVKQSSYFSTDLDSTVLLDGDGIAGIHRLKKFVTKKIDRDHAAIVPDVIDDQSPSCDAVDV